MEEIVRLTIETLRDKNENLTQEIIELKKQIQEKIDYNEELIEENKKLKNEIDKLKTQDNVAEVLKLQSRIDKTYNYIKPLLNQVEAPKCYVIQSHNKEIILRMLKGND